MADALPHTIVGATGQIGATPSHNAPDDPTAALRGVQFYKYPENLGTAPFDKWIFFEARSGRHVMRNTVVSEENGKDRTLSAVGLYLSETVIRSSLSVAYDETALGPLWGAAVDAAAQGAHNSTDARFSPGTGITGLLQALKNGAVGTVTAALNSNFKGLLGAEAFTLGAGLLEGIPIKPGEGGTAAALSTVFGTKPNPRTDVLFNTQSFRTHDMNFTLIPRTLAEAQHIDRILSFFQFYMLPSYSTQPDNNLGVGSAMLGFPYEFEISLRDGANHRLEHVNKFERCVLKNITIDHASAGKSAFIKNNGEFYPVASSMQLTFQEVRLLDRRSDAITRNPRGVVSPTVLPDPRI